MSFDYTPYVTARYMTWAEDAISHARKEFPLICPNGLTPFDGDDQTWNKSDLAMICLCREFFLKAKKIKKPDWTSYGIKHFIEKYYIMDGRRVYVHNGATIVAALACDISYKVYSNMNLLLGVSHFHATKKMTQKEELAHGVLFDL